MKKLLLTTQVLALGLALITARPLLADQPNSRQTQSLAERVRHELAMLPRYTVFDNIDYTVDGNTVTLTGQVTRPIIKDDAEGAAKHVEGVGEVINRIEVLPLSPMDWRIRQAEFWALYSGPLARYGIGSLKAIHIIVKNGQVTLKGVVNNQGDKEIATMRAKQVPGTFSVTNDLQVQG